MEDLKKEATKVTFHGCREQLSRKIEKRKRKRD
jgi:hypothetical protein